MNKQSLSFLLFLALFLLGLIFYKNYYKTDTLNNSGLSEKGTNLIENINSDSIVLDETITLNKVSCESWKEDSVCYQSTDFTKEETGIVYDDGGVTETKVTSGYAMSFTNTEEFKYDFQSICSPGGALYVNDCYELENKGNKILVRFENKYKDTLTAFISTNENVKYYVTGEFTPEEYVTFRSKFDEFLIDFTNR